MRIDRTYLLKLIRERRTYAPGSLEHEWRTNALRRLIRISQGAGIGWQPTKETV